MPEDEHLKQVFKRAADIASSVPAALRQAAFNRALDTLLPKPLGDPLKEPESKRGRKGSRRKVPKRADAAAQPGKKPIARRSSGRLGPKAALEELLQASFWNQPRTIGQLREHLRTIRGHNYKVQELSPALGRLLRDEKIERAKNKESQYEYKRK